MYFTVQCYQYLSHLIPLIRPCKIFALHLYQDLLLIGPCKDAGSDEMNLHILLGIPSLLLPAGAYGTREMLPFFFIIVREWDQQLAKVVSIRLWSSGCLDPTTKLNLP